MGFLFGGKGTTTRAEKIGDFQINTASYGEVVPEILGTTRVSGNIIYWDDFTAHEHRETQRAGKGGGRKHTNITYTYTVAVAIGLCEGPISGIGMVWRDKDVLMYPSGDIQLTLFDGRKGQAPWPYVVSKHPEKALPYSGLAYMAGVVDLGDRASLPTYNFEVRGNLLNTGDGTDVNPADYIVRVLERVGIEASVIEGLDNFRQYCAAADILISTPPDEGARKAQEIIADIADITNSYLFWSNDRLKIVPLADKPINTWDPHSTIQYDLTADDFLPGKDGVLVEYKRKTSTESYNQAIVEFINRSNSYEKETVSYEVVADVQKNGLKPAPVKKAHYLYTKKRAAYYAEQLAMKRLYERNQYTFKLAWNFCRLEPGDIVTLTDEVCQINEQVVVITEVQEGVDGELTITAIGKPPGIYAPAAHDVHENERSFVDYNVKPPAVTDVTFVQPPADVTTSGNEVWLAVSAPETNWGGCNIWVSDSGDMYKELGTTLRAARVGKLVGSMKATDTTCTVRMSNGVLKPGSHLDAERANTLCWINGECVSYETARLNADGTIVLGGLIRGQYNTTAAAHSAGDKIVRVDEALVRYQFRNEDIGKRIWIKCTSMNVFGSSEQDLSEVKAYEYTLRKYFIPDVSNYALTTVYRALGGRAVSYDLVATFTLPELQSLDTAEAWYREVGGEWKFAGVGSGRIVISGCDVGKTYEVNVQVKDIYGNYSQGVVRSKRIEMKSEVPNTPEGFEVRFSTQAIFNWREVTNADIDFYEVRLTMQPGQTAGLIARSTNTTAAGILQKRSGTVYLYAHNPVKGYSAPAIVTYNVPAPPVPSNITIRPQLTGLAISFAVIPGNCTYANVYIDSSVHQTNNNSLFIPLDAGVYRVRISYVDMFGEGPRSNEALATIKATIPKELLDLEAMGITSMDKAIASLKTEQGTIKKDVSGIQTKLTQATTGFTQSVTDLKNSWESRFTQISDGFDMRITEGLDNLTGDKLISRINLSKSGARIDGSLFHVTGKTLFDDNVIVNKMLAADAVTADKISVNSLSAICATIGTLRTRTSGARTEIKDNLIEVYDANNRLRVRMGIW